MNPFLLATLIISGVVELAVAVWALVHGFTDAAIPGWLGASEAQVSTSVSAFSRLLLTIIGMVSLGMAGLHAASIQYLRREKSEGYHLAIGMGGACVAVGLVAFVAGRFGPGTIVGPQYFLILDGLRGLVLGAVAVFAMNAPSVIRDLRVPASRDRARSRHAAPESRERSSRGERGDRRDRGERGHDRGPRRSRDDRGPRRRDSGTSSRSVPAARGPREPVDTGHRERVRAPAAPGEPRGLSVVVSGLPPEGARSNEDAIRRPPARSESTRNGETVSTPRPPLVPRVRTEMPPLRSQGERGGDSASADGADDRRSSRRRRRRPSSRAGHDRPHRPDAPQDEPAGVELSYEPIPRPQISMPTPPPIEDRPAARDRFENRWDRRH